MRLILLVLIVSFSFFTSAKAQNGDAQTGKVIAQVIENDVPEHLQLDTLSENSVHVYPDIMQMFKGARNYSVDNNPYDAFLTKQSLERGRKFLNEHQKLLATAEDSFGVSKEAFVAFLRVESNFGSHTDTHQALGVFLSILHYSSNQERKSWARQELLALLSVTKAMKTSLTAVRSSYAGAIGFPQFLPSSIRSYAVDGNGDGEVNLFTLADAVWSIGNYLTAHGWPEDRREAILAYNPSGLYADCILEYAAAL